MNKFILFFDLVALLYKTQLMQLIKSSNQFLFKIEICEHVYKAIESIP